jgi:hypothetical protein
MGFGEGGTGGVVTERRGLFVASIVPEPTGALVGLVLGTGLLLRRGRARRGAP